MDFFQNGKSLGNQLSDDDLIAMQDSQTGDRGYARAGDVLRETLRLDPTAGLLLGGAAPNAEQRAKILAGMGIDGGGRIVVADVSPSKTAAENTAAIVAAHAALANIGGTVMIPGGNIPVVAGIDVSARNSDDTFGGSVTFRGAGMGATRLIQTGTGALFTKTEGHAHALRDLSLIGPGVGVSSVATDWENAAGGALWENVWIQGFEAGSQFYDATSMTFVNCHWHANGTNIRLGYNCDIFQFFGGRIQNATVDGIHIGWRGPDQPVGSVLCSPVTFVCVRFGDVVGNAILVDDAGASQIRLQSCYFEHNGKIITVGTSGTVQSAKSIIFDECFFTRPVSFSDPQMQVADDNSDSTIEVSNCTSDATYTGPFIKIGTTGSLTWANNKIPVSGAGSNFKIGTNAGYVVPDGQSYEWNKNKITLADGTLMASGAPASAVRMTNGTGKQFAEWSRRSSSTGALVGSGHAYVSDIDGKWVVFDGVQRIGTPSSALPAASATYRGVNAYQQGGGGVADTVVCCMKDAAGAYSWKVVATG